VTYKFKYRRGLIWRSAKVTGHRYEQALDKMVLFFADGSLREIAEWSKFDLKLGLDWALVMKKAMEEKAGQAVPVKGV